MRFLACGVFAIEILVARIKSGAKPNGCADVGVPLLREAPQVN
jgi:hypothetical protein